MEASCVGGRALPGPREGSLGQLSHWVQDTDVPSGVPSTEPNTPRTLAIEYIKCKGFGS